MSEPRVIPEEQPSVQELQALLREARSYVYYNECTNDAEYDAQQSLLERIDHAAPEPKPPPKETCGKAGPHGDPCLSDKGHEGECDDLPF